MIHLHALLHRRTRYYNALFFEDAFHFQNNFPLKIKYHFSKDVKASSKIKSKKEYQILVPDKKRLYFLIWFFHPSKEFDTLSEDVHLSNQLPILQINPIKQEHSDWIFKTKNKKKESKDKFQVFRKKSSSPTGFKKNLHP
jgi:hypothetical protein